MFARKRIKINDIKMYNVFDSRMADNGTVSFDGDIFVERTATQKTKTEINRFLDRAHRYKDSFEEDWIKEEHERISRCIDAELGIASETVEADVFGKIYKVKDEWRKHASPAYMNTPARWCIQDERLNIVVGTTKYSFLMKEIAGFQKIEERLHFLRWTKKDRFTKVITAEYQLGKEWSSGFYYTFPYYSIEVLHHGTRFQIIVAQYDGAGIVEKLKDAI